MLEFGCQPWFLRQKVKGSNDGRRKWSAKESRATLEKWKDEKSIEAWNAWNAWNRRPGRFDICQMFLLELSTTHLFQINATDISSGETKYCNVAIW